MNNVITVLGVVGGPAQAVAGSADEAKGMSAEKKKALKIRGDWQSLWRKRGRGFNQGMDGFMCHCCIHETFKKVRDCKGEGRLQELSSRIPSKIFKRRRK